MGFRRYATLEVIDSQLARPGAPLLKDAHRHEFNYTPRPGFLYVRSRAISSRCNDNFDEFPAEEIKKGWRTFIGKPVFVNHRNDDPKKARGVIIDAALHEDVNPDGSPDVWVETLHEIDAVRYPKLAQAIIAGESDRTSMGTNVEYSVCTACGNKAYTPLEYCAHIPRMKGQRIYRVNASTGEREGVLIAERCYGLSFFENSHLVEPPADPTAYLLGVDARGLEKTASRREKYEEMRSQGLPIPSDLRRTAAVRPPAGIADGASDNGWVAILNWFINYNHGKKDPNNDRFVDPDAYSYSDIAYGLNRAKNRGSGMLDEALRDLKSNQIIDLVNRIHDEMGYRNITQGAVEQWVYKHADEIIGVRAENTQTGQGSMIFPHNSKLANRDEWSEEFSNDDRSHVAQVWRDGNDKRATYEAVCYGSGCDWRKTTMSEDEATREARSHVGLSAEARKLAYGEQLAPAEVDTLRDATCPVCGESDTYNGDECLVCGFHKPPDQFLDPDLEKAKQVDLRQDAQEEAADPSGATGVSDQPLDHFVPPDGNDPADEQQQDEEQDEEQEDDDASEDDEPSDVKKKDRKKQFPPKKESHLEGEDVEMRPVLAALAEQQIVQQNQQAQIDAIANLAGLDLSKIKADVAPKIAALRKQSDENNPAQPIPDPAAEAPSQTTQEALAPDGRDDPTSVGASPVTDVSADATTDVMGTTTVLDQPLDLNEKDPTKPVAGTEEVRPLDEVRTETEVRAGTPSNNGVAFPLEGDFARTPSVGSVSEPRVLASLRLARLRIQADIADGATDDIALSTDIANNADLTDDAISSEIETLSKVVQRQAAAGPEQARVARRLVPQAMAVEGSVVRTAPSLVTHVGNGDEVPSQEMLHTSALGVTPDEMIFEG